MAQTPARAPVSAKKGSEVKPVKKAFDAEDYATGDITVEEVKEIRTAFDIVDTDGNECVSVEEFKAFIERRGDGLFSNALEILLKDGKQQYTFEEFFKLMLSSKTE